MNRLTRRTTNCPLPVLVRDRAFGPAYFVSEEDYTDYRDALEKLARYEDTGLEPEQCAKYAQAEKEGRLLVLPCKVGDMVWAFWYLPTSSRYVIYCAEVKEFRLREKHFGRDISVLLEPVDFRGRRKEYGEDDFGKTVFPTREDAEKALDGMKNDE